MWTTKDAPGAAKFMLNWPTTDANIARHSGTPFLYSVRLTVQYFSDKVALTLPDDLDQLRHQFLLQQWLDIEEMLVERGP
jgi:hypothetical protein